VEFLTWAALSLEALTTTSATRHLPWRMRLYAVICHCYEDMGDLKAARAALERVVAKVAGLRSEEEVSLPRERSARKKNWRGGATRVPS
jgi:hypothetical protein